MKEFVLPFIVMALWVLLIIAGALSLPKDEYKPLYTGGYWRGSADYANEMAGHRAAGRNQVIGVIEEKVNRLATDSLLNETFCQYETLRKLAEELRENK